MLNFIQKSALLLVVATTTSPHFGGNHVPRGVEGKRLGDPSGDPAAGENRNLDEEIDFLENFKNIDPADFEWIKPENIKAGATTCGFLHADLGSEPDVVYPKVEVYICVQFAEIQPARRGNLFVHCGGPGGLSGCIDTMGSSIKIGYDNVENYNIISIDQRGMGRSLPSLYQRACEFSSLWPASEGNKYTSTEIQAFLDRKKNDVESCWSVEDFHFNNIAQYDDYGFYKGDRSFHFLEYSGTRQLVEDIGRFMVLIDETNISLYGISYGATVVSTFATFYPLSVNQFVADASMTPFNSVEDFASSVSTGSLLRYNYLKYTCWAARLNDPSGCPVDDIGQCLSDLQDLNLIGEIDRGNNLDDLLDYITDRPDTMKDVCDAAAEGNRDKVLEIFYGDERKKRATQGISFCDGYDQPSSATLPLCFDVGTDPYSVVDQVIGQDYAGSVSQYDDNVFVEKVLRFQEEYYNDEFPEVIGDFMKLLSYNYYWPKNVPLPIRGSPEITGIISGQMYDYATPYTWTTETRGQFPNTHLLTSQSVYHGLNGGSDGPCQKHIVKYLETGDIDFTDSTVCGDHYPFFDGQIGGNK